MKKVICLFHLSFNLSAFDLRNLVDIVKVFERIQSLSGIEIEKHVLHEMKKYVLVIQTFFSLQVQESKIENTIFVDSDIVMRVVVKQPDIVESAKGKLLLEEAKQKNNAKEVEKLKNFSDSLETPTPSNGKGHV